MMKSQKRGWMVAAGKTRRPSILEDKKMFARISFVIMGLVFVAALGGCGDKDSGVNDSPDDDKQDSLGVVPPELAAAWTFQGASINSQIVPLHQLFSWEAGTAACRITINRDGSYVYQELAADSSVQWAEAGTFSVSGDNYTMTTGHPLLESGTWAVNDDRLTLTATTQAGYALLIEAIK